MQTHAIIQLEEGSLNVLVGGADGARTRVLHSSRIPLPDMSRDAIDNALRTVGSDMLRGAEGVHVVIGDRRSEHFLSTIPMMSSRDAVAFVVREALRLTNSQSADEILVAPRLIKRLPGKKVLVGSAALTRSVWEPVRAAFESRGLPVLSLQTIESCLAMTDKTARPEPVAVLECNGGRARYVLSVDQTPVKVRRFLIGAGGDQNEATLMTQLAMELPRTMDWLRESGEVMPQRLVIGSRLGLGDESLEMLAAADVGEMVRCQLGVECDEDMSQPDMGVAALLHRLAKGLKPTSLLDEPKLRMPAGAGHIVTTLAAASVGLLASFSAVVDGSAWMEARQERDGLEEQCADVQFELDEMQSEEAANAAPAVDPRLASALQMRRPISRLLGELSNAAGAEISIQELKFASKSPVVVTGRVQGRGRQEALTAMAKFTAKVHALPYVVARGEDEMSEVPGVANCFRFKLNLAWRTQ